MLTPERRREIEVALSAAQAARQCSASSGSDDPVFGALVTLAFDTPLHAMARELLEEVERLTKEQAALFGWMVRETSSRRGEGFICPALRGGGPNLTPIFPTEAKCIEAIRKAVGLSEH